MHAETTDFVLAVVNEGEEDSKKEGGSHCNKDEHGGLDIPCDRQDAHCNT